MCLANMASIAQRLRSTLALAEPSEVDHDVIETVAYERFDRRLIQYSGDAGDRIPAFLFSPHDCETSGAVVVFHQHNSEFHLGKSEVAGEAGDVLQAFGPALADQGIAVLAPDALTFEDRRTGAVGAYPSDNDWLQHYNAMAYHLIDGDVLMRKCLDDAQRAVSVLTSHPGVCADRVGVFGHSYGGTTAMYLAAVDGRCRFVGISGATCSFETRMKAGTAINMFELVPGLATQIEIHDLLRAISPRPTLVASATNDPYAADADEVVQRAGAENVTELRVDGDHALDEGRFEGIVDWLSAEAV